MSRPHRRIIIKEKLLQKLIFQAQEEAPFERLPQDYTARASTNSVERAGIFYLCGEREKFIDNQPVTEGQ